jgi:spore germination cell wall hydrolase CwlJ-like protein
MNLMTLAALCVMSANGSGQVLPTGTDCPAVERSYQAKLTAVSPMVSGLEPRDAIARVAYAEAGNQGDTGLAGVVYTILNRLMDGGFGGGLNAVLDAPHQFEPVSKAGGWQRLPQRDAVEQAHVDTILNLALDGRLPDPTNGARYFQNPAIVAARAEAGTVSSGLVNFGGQKPVAVIHDHAFYATSGGSNRQAAATPSLFVPVQTASDGATRAAQDAPPLSQPPSLFVPLSR